ncbi:MAG: hypothetical protein QXS36_02975 [Candidatus Bathyarchaeia archaeon]
MKRKVHVLAIFWILLMPSHLIIRCYAWGNGGYSSSPSSPKYGTHDWIAEHALDWLPSEAKQWIAANLNLYLYGTELPDNGRAPDGIGDTSLHHIYFSAGGILMDDAAACRANETFNQALAFMLLGDFASAAKYVGAMTHYIADMAVFGHVMGAGTDWGAEVHHDDYEDYVGRKTSSYNSEWSAYLSFDGDLRPITAYDAAVELAYDTTFDRSGEGLTCVWMDRNYNWSNPTFVARVLESLNLAVNYITDVLYTLYMAYVAQTPTFTLTVYVYHASFGIQGVTVKIDGVSYITDYSGSVSVQVAPGSHVVEVVSPFQSSSGVRYTFIGWSDYSTSNPRTIVVSSDTTVAAYMEIMPGGAPSGGGQTVAVTFTASGLENPSPAKPILVVDNQFYGADQLPITFTWEVGSTHGYSWAEIVESTSEDTRFRLAFVTGLSDKFLDFITVPPEGGFIEAIYKTQYRVGIGAEAGKGTTEPSPGIYWFDAGTRVNVTAIPGPKYEFKMWKAIIAAGATYDRYGNPTIIWLGGPIDIVAEFTEAFDYQITLTPSSISLYRGKSADISVQVERTAGEARRKIDLSLTGAPSGISYKFNVESDYPPLYATLTITASNNAPIGTHILTVRVLYGEVVKEASLSVTIMEPEKAWYEQPWILAAVALTAIVVIAIIIRRRRA